eukprot:1195935-Prorocentrum_minimum.AAC.2
MDFTKAHLRGLDFLVKDEKAVLEVGHLRPQEAVKRGSRGSQKRVKRGSRGGLKGVKRGSRGGQEGVERGEGGTHSSNKLINVGMCRSRVLLQKKGRLTCPACRQVTPSRRPLDPSRRPLDCPACWHFGFGAREVRTDSVDQ